MVGYGVNELGNNWRYMVINFIIVFLAQVVFKLFEYLPNQRLPNEYELYSAVIIGAATTLSFFGLNKLQLRRNSSKDSDTG